MEQIVMLPLKVYNKAIKRLEQQKEYLDDKSGQHDAQITKIQKTINKLKQY